MRIKCDYSFLRCVVTPSCPTLVAILFLSDSSACSPWDEKPSIDCSRERRSILMLWVNFWNRGNETRTRKADSMSVMKLPAMPTGESLCVSAGVSWPTGIYRLKATAVIPVRRTFKSLGRSRPGEQFNWFKNLLKSMRPFTPGGKYSQTEQFLQVLQQTF